MNKKDRKSVEELINDFLECWDLSTMYKFFRDIIPLFELYDIDKEDDWVKKEVGGDDDNVRTIRLVSTVYLMSRIADFHTGKLLSINTRFKDLWKKMEKAGLEYKESQNE